MASTEDITVKLNKEVASIIKRSGINKQFVSSKKDVTYSDLFSNRMLIINVIKEGVTYSFFNLIQNYSPFSENDWAKFLDISTKSLHRYKQTSKLFKPTHSEKIIEVAEVTNVGLDVFGEMDKFKRWLNTPNFSLGTLSQLNYSMIPMVRKW